MFRLEFNCFWQDTLLNIFRFLVGVFGVCKSLNLCLYEDFLNTQFFYQSFLNLKLLLLWQCVVLCIIHQFRQQGTTRPHPYVQRFPGSSDSPTSFSDYSDQRVFLCTLSLNVVFGTDHVGGTLLYHLEVRLWVVLVPNKWNPLNGHPV